MTEVRNELKTALTAVRDQGQLAQLLLNFLSLTDGQIRMVAPVLKSLGKFAEEHPEPDKKELEHLNWITGLFAQMIELTTTDALSFRMLQHMLHMYRSQMTAATFLPEPFSRSHVVLGALALMVRVRRKIRHNHDLPNCAIYWAKRLGKLEGSWADGRYLGIHPGLVPVAFLRGADFSKSELNQQFFGFQPALRQFDPQNPDIPTLFAEACNKWPLEDFYAFAPIPTWAACHEGKSLWLEGLTWQEQQLELLHLQRLHRDLTVRFATLPELMFIDLCMRLATGGSPMEIGAYRCENPLYSSKCLKYGSVGQYGAEVSEDRVSSTAGEAVMPLFIPRVTRETKEAKETPTPTPPVQPIQ
ncbi:MAG: hypothetical protein WC518_04210 [Patescibacteria group bacterium]